MKPVMCIIVLCYLALNLTPVFAAANIADNHGELAVLTAAENEPSAVIAFRSYPYRRAYHAPSSKLPDFTAFYQQFQKYAMKL